MTTMVQTVYYIVIMACLEVEAKHVMGLQLLVEINGEVTTNLDTNANGTDKYYPHGPTYFYNGKELPCCFTCNENGSITSNIYLQNMQYLNQHVGLDGSALSVVGLICMSQ